MAATDWSVSTLNLGAMGAIVAGVVMRAFVRIALKRMRREEQPLPQQSFRPLAFD
jgi:hypothetical protein